MGRPSKGARSMVPVRMAADLAARVDAFASARGLDRGSAVCELVERGLDGGAPGSRALVTAASPAPGRNPPVAASAPTVAARKPRLAGFDALTGAPVYR